MVGQQFMSTYFSEVPDAATALPGALDGRLIPIPWFNPSEGPVRTPYTLLVAIDAHKDGSRIVSDL
jgi:hypothetical protein